MRAHDRAGRVLALPSQAKGVAGRYGLTRPQLDTEVWVVTPDGRRLGGAAAVNHVLRELAGGWRWLGTVMETPGLRQLEAAFYRWFARHRDRFAAWGIPPECDSPEANCDP